MAPTVGLTGDVMLGRKIDEAQRTRPADAVWGDVGDRLRALDGLFLNLECCLSTRGRPWRRTHRPFHFRADPEWAVPALDAAGTDLVTLANNHALDYEEQALRDTFDTLDDAGIARIGAGRSEAEAVAPTYVSVEGIDVVVVAFTDNTPEYAAEGDSPGVAHTPMDLRAAEREGVGEVLARARSADPDLLVASLHWGPNMVEVPDERYREFGRWLVERGVDLVHGHSAHVFQGIEMYDGVPILYDCGDFVDDYRVDRELRNDRSFLFEVTIGEGRVTELRLRPVRIADFAVHRVAADEADWWHGAMRERSRPFGTADAFEREGADLVLPVV